jgi:hypothetical protein
MWAGKERTHLPQQLLIIYAVADVSVPIGFVVHRPGTAS